MLDIRTVNTRDVLRHHKRVFGLVQRTRQPHVIVSQDKPQVAIISLEDLRELEYVKQSRATRALLDLAGFVRKGSGLPSDLSEHHNEYTWD